MRKEPEGNLITLIRFQSFEISVVTPLHTSKTLTLQSWAVVWAQAYGMTVILLSRMAIYGIFIVFRKSNIRIN